MVPGITSCDRGSVAFDWQEKDILPLEDANERSEPGPAADELQTTRLAQSA